jgi:transcriptional regulator with XRE-family HTH domain
MENKAYAGELVKSLREEKGISLEILSQKSGVDVAVLQKIEESKGLPSLNPLIKVARALDVRIGTFLEDRNQTGPVLSRRKDIEDSFMPCDTASQKRQMQYFSTSQSKAGRHMESYVIRFEACAESDFVLSSHEGEEFIFVLEGAVEINYGAETYQLQTGDSIYYDSIVAHHVHAECGEAAKILAVIYTPV